MKKISLIIIIFLIFVFVPITYAACPPALTNNCGSSCLEADCTPSYGQGICVCTSTPKDPGSPGENANSKNSGWLGTITNPIAGGSLGPGGGLITLLNNVLRLVFVFAGIYVFVQIVLAGIGFMSASGDSKKIEKAWNTIWQSILGLAIIVGALAIAALIGLLLFGNVGAILNPQIYGPG